MNSPSTSSGLIAVTAGTAVSTAPGRLTSVTLNPGSAVSSIVIYDNASAASGTVLMKLVSPANGASIEWHQDEGAVVNNGVYVVVAGTGAEAVVHYTRG